MENTVFVKTMTEDEKTTVNELRKKYIGRRFCIYKGINRGLIGKCRWIEARTMKVLGESHTSIWYRLEVPEGDGYYFPKVKSYWEIEDNIIRIQDEPDEIPFRSGW